MLVMDKRDILDYAECIGNGRWFEPPLSLNGLAKSLRVAVHHSLPIYVKRNIMASNFIPHPMMSQQELSKLALDYLVFGNAFTELRLNGLGKPLRLETTAKFTRTGMKEGAYWFVNDWKEQHEFSAGSMFHLLEPDIN